MNNPDKEDGFCHLFFVVCFIFLRKIASFAINTNRSLLNNIQSINKNNQRFTILCCKF